MFKMTESKAKILILANQLKERDCYASFIGDKLDLEYSNLTRSVKRMEANGLLTRKLHISNYAVNKKIIFPTEEGLKQAKAFLKAKSKEK